MLAAARTNVEHWRVAFGWGWSGLALCLILKGRVLERIHDCLSARTDRASVVRAVSAAWFVLAVDTFRLAGVALAAALWPDGENLPAHMTGSFAALPVDLLVGGPALFGLLSLTALSPRWGWVGLSAFGGLVIFLGILIPPVSLSPAHRHDRPAPIAHAAPILSFVREGGLDARTLFVFDSPDPVAVDMEGLGPITHAGVSTAVLAAPSPEAYAAIGHLLGHYRHKDLWWMALLWTGVATGVLFFIWRLQAGGDVAALPAIGLIIWAGFLIATPAFNLFDQAINYRADDYALALTGDPDGLCRWLVATEAQGKANPSALEALLFYDHPPLEARLINAMRWKAVHNGGRL